MGICRSYKLCGLVKGACAREAETLRNLMGVLFRIVKKLDDTRFLGFLLDTILAHQRAVLSCFIFGYLGWISCWLAIGGCYFLKEKASEQACITC